MQIQMVDLNGQYEKIKNEINRAISKVLDECRFIQGPEVKEFSENFASFNACDKVIPCANGTDALQIALMAIDAQPGDEIVLPVHTYVATAEVIALLQLKPVFVDVDYDNFNILPDQVNNVISSKTKAIVPVHLYGQCAPMEELLRIGRKNSVFIIEDSAQAVGAQYTFNDGSKKYAGTIGNIGATSFFPSKNLGCYGDGGALMTDDPKLAEICEMIASHGQKKKYYHDIVGINSRLDTIQAAILNVKIKYLDEYTKARQEVAHFYNKELSAIESIKLPERMPYSSHVYHQYTVKVMDGKRDSLREYLQIKGIPTMIYYPVPLHLQKAYNNYGYQKGDFPTAEKLSTQVLSLPIHTEMNEEQLMFISDSIKSFFNG